MKPPEKAIGKPETAWPKSLPAREAIGGGESFA
jgi:hypothetical protein